MDGWMDVGGGGRYGMVWYGLHQVIPLSHRLTSVVVVVVVGLIGIGTVR